MEEKEPIGIKFSTVLIIIAIVVIIAVGGLIYLSFINKNDEEDLIETQSGTEVDFEKTTNKVTSNEISNNESNYTGGISAGKTISQETQNVITSGQMTETEVSTFNHKFVKYEGMLKGTMVKTLIQEVITTNKNSAETDGIVVKVNGILPTTFSNIVSNDTYKSEMEYQDGRVSNIKITNAETEEQIEIK